MPAMTPRKRVKCENPWPVDWTVRFEWEFEGPRGCRPLKHPIVAKSRQHDIKVGQSWYQFERHVVTGKDVTWLDAFEIYPMGGYKAFRPEQVTAVRVHVEPKKKKPAER